MNELQIFNNDQFGEIRTIDENGSVLFCGSDVAKALGYTNPNKALNDHCRAITKRSTPISGKMQEINFIPECDLYRLIVKSQLPAAEQFEKWVFEEVLPTIRKTGSYSATGLTPTDMLELQVKALRAMEQKQAEQAAAIAATNARLDTIKDTIQLNPNSWREDSRKIIVKIAQKMGGNEFIQEITKEIYGLVDSRAGASLERRLTLKRQRMAEEGATLSKRNKLNKVDVIADDKKLTEIYIAIVKEMAIKYLDTEAA